MLNLYEHVFVYFYVMCKYNDEYESRLTLFSILQYHGSLPETDLVVTCAAGTATTYVFVFVVFFVFVALFIDLLTDTVQPLSRYVAGQSNFNPVRVYCTCWWYSLCTLEY